MPTYGEGSDNDEINIIKDHVNDADAKVYQEHIKELDEVQVLIDQLDPENPISAEEFVQCDIPESTAEIISDEEILKAVLPQEKEIEIEEVPLPTISHNEVIESYDKVILYLEQQQDNFDMKKDDLRLVKKLRKEVLKCRFISAKQSNLDVFINVIE
jgi:hypothetical protein